MPTEEGAPSKGSLIVGRVVIVIIIICALGWFFSHHVQKKPGQSAPGVPTASTEPISVNGAVGGEKLGYLQDPQVIAILAHKYGITVVADKEGSIDMVKGPTTGRDFLWPSSQVALEMYKQRPDGTMKNSATIFSSPIVLYSWEPVAEALIKAHIVQKIEGSYYVVDLPKLIQMINTGKQWKDIGLPDLYGRISIRSTDPTRSNSGMMFAGLLANIESGNGSAATEASLSTSLPTIKSFFGRLGYMEGSSGDLFDQFVTQGEGQNPIMVGYENQLTEYAIAHPEYRSSIQQQIRIMYPRPTVWSDHPIIALTDNGMRLLNALKSDPELKQIAWKSHGFRTGIQNDPKELQFTGIPATIQNVVPMPPPKVIDRILTALAK